MHAMPVDDFFAQGRVRGDGRLLHGFLLVEVKAPSESKAPWDYYKVRRRIPAEEAAQPLSQSTCPLLRKTEASIQVHRPSKRTREGGSMAPSVREAANGWGTTGARATRPGPAPPGPATSSTSRVSRPGRAVAPFIEIAHARAY